jgi:hypothetical protein
MAHLLELLNKINLSHENYLTVQQIYHGWALLGIIIAGELFSVGALRHAAIVGTDETVSFSGSCSALIS